MLPQQWEKKSLETLEAEVRNVDFMYKASTGKEVGIVWDKDCHKLTSDLARLGHKNKDAKESKKKEVRSL